jgi:hypothetical protein
MSLYSVLQILWLVEGGADEAHMLDSQFGTC